jgi:hypothetical protein
VTSAATTLATSPKDGRAPSTAILHSPHAYGHRIFFDGRSIGEGGRDMLVPCGSHRVRVGSGGVDRSVTLPCGGTITLD